MELVVTFVPTPGTRGCQRSVRSTSEDTVNDGLAVSIRRATAADASCINRIRAEPSVRRYQPIHQHTVERIAAILGRRESTRLDRELDGKVQWVIECEGQCAGWVTLDVTSREHSVASVGYSVSEAFRGRGLATGAVRQVIAIAFDPDGLALDRLEANAAVENIASRRVLIKAGFREEGIAEGLLVINGIRVDHVRFGLVREVEESGEPISE